MQGVEIDLAIFAARQPLSGQLRQCGRREKVFDRRRCQGVVLGPRLSGASRRFSQASVGSAQPSSPAVGKRVARLIDRHATTLMRLEVKPVGIIIVAAPRRQRNR